MLAQHLVKSTTSSLHWRLTSSPVKNIDILCKISSHGLFNASLRHARDLDVDRGLVPA
jgi:hypothetical protein